MQITANFFFFLSVTARLHHAEYSDIAYNMNTISWFIFQQICFTVTNVKFWSVWRSTLDSKIIVHSWTNIGPTLGCKVWLDKLWIQIFFNIGPVLHFKIIPQSILDPSMDKIWTLNSKITVHSWTNTVLDQHRVSFFVIHSFPMLDQLWILKSLSILFHHWTSFNSELMPLSVLNTTIDQLWIPRFECIPRV